MNMYRILMDSTKLFFLNVFLYTLFLEVYMVGYVLETRYGLELSFATLFISGIFTFIFITVWMNAALAWNQWIKSQHELLLRALCSEIPFVLLLVIALLIGTSSHVSDSARADLWSLFLLFIGYLIAFPAVMVLAKSHRKKVDSL